jgi:hypothetical protein
MLEVEMSDTKPTLPELVEECDELFRKYQADGWIGPTSFKAALREYKRREWVGLTLDEKAYSNTDYAGKCAESWQSGVEWAEVKLKEKNG